MNISINISNIDGTDVYSLSRKNEPGYFRQVMTSKQEGDKKAELSDEELDELRKKYNTGRFMLDKENSDLMSEAAYEKIKEVSAPSGYTKKYLWDYETYMSVLEKIRS